MELGLYSLRSFIEGSFVVVLVIKIYYKLTAAINKRTKLVYANLAYFTLSAQQISYISYSCKPRGRSTRNKLKYILNNYVFRKLS
jgi:hypothetical protein